LKKSFPALKPKLFQGYREMLERWAGTLIRHGFHARSSSWVAAIRAMQMGKALLCQKPLVQTVSEARIGRQWRRIKNCHPDGQPGKCRGCLRRAVEVIQAGVIGVPHELHVWCNRPVWPTAIERPPARICAGKSDWIFGWGRLRQRPYKDRNLRSRRVASW